MPFLSLHTSVMDVPSCAIDFTIYRLMNWMRSSSEPCRPYCFAGVLMADLRNRFGQLVAAHRKSRGMTQAQLAETTGMSPTMIVRIEAGSSGARFPNIEKIAAALEIDPSELFVVGSASRRRVRRSVVEIDALIAGLSDRELVWVHELLEVALRLKR